MVGPAGSWPYLALAGCLSALVFLLVRGALIDDAYITLSYARTLAEHFGWGVTRYRTANTAESPLQVLLLGAVTAVVRRPVLALGLVFTALNTLQMWGLLRLFRVLGLPRGWSAVVFAFVLLSPLMLSIVGMEMTLVVTLLVLAVDASARGNATEFGVLAGLLLVTRVDLVVFPVVLLIANGRLRGRLARITLAAVGVAAPWYVVSWLVLGALVPDTLTVPALAGTWGIWDFANGPLLYLQAYRVAVLVSAVPALLGALALVGYLGSRAWRRPALRGLGPVAALGVGGAVHYAVSAQLALTPFHWNYAPAVASLTIVFGTAVACLRRGRRTGSGDGDGDGEAARTAPVGTRRAYALAVEALPVLVLLADLVVAGRHGLPWEESAISTNWALPGQYAAVGADLRGRGTVIGSPGEIGTLAFFCRCDIVDAFSDRGVVLPLIRQQEDRSGPVGRRFLRLNFQHLDDGQRPASPDEVLVHRPEPPRGADSWPVRSSWRGAGSLTLEKR